MWHDFFMSNNYSGVAQIRATRHRARIFTFEPQGPYATFCFCTNGEQMPSSAIIEHTFCIKRSSEQDMTRITITGTTKPELGFIGGKSANK